MIGPFVSEKKNVRNLTNKTTKQPTRVDYFNYNDNFTEVLVMHGHARETKRCYQPAQTLSPTRGPVWAGAFTGLLSRCPVTPESSTVKLISLVSQSSLRWKLGDVVAACTFGQYAENKLSQFIQENLFVQSIRVRLSCYISFVEQPILSEFFISV